MIRHVSRYSYPTPNRTDAWCELRILEGTDGGAVAIATELADNPGMSITNAAEDLWDQVAAEHADTPLTFVEHYPANGGLRGETFDLVTRVREGLTGVGWSPSDRDRVAKLVVDAQELPPKP